MDERMNMKFRFELMGFFMALAMMVSTGTWKNYNIIKQV